MELTKNEIEIAERYIAKRERQLAQWPRRRWLMLAICLVFAVVGYRTVSDGMGGINNDKATDLEVSRAFGEAPPPGQENRWAVGTMMKIGKILELRHQVVTYALMQVAVGSVQILGVMIMVCVTIL